MRRHPADHHMIAAPGAGMLAVDHELVGTQPQLPGFFIHRFGGRDSLGPTVRGVDIDLDHARIRCHPDHVQARIKGRRIAFDMQPQSQLPGGILGRSHQFQIILDPFHRRHEDAQPPVARLDRNGSPNRARHVRDHLFAAVLHRLGRGETRPLLPELIGRVIRQGSAILHRVGR